MSGRDEPWWADDGMLVHRNATVYVCDAEDAQAGGLDVHIDITDGDGDLERLMFDSSATIYDSEDLRDAWMNAASWLEGTAETLREMADWIRKNDVGAEVANG